MVEGSLNRIIPFRAVSGGFLNRVIPFRLQRNCNHLQVGRSRPTASRAATIRSFSSSSPAQHQLPVVDVTPWLSTIKQNLLENTQPGAPPTTPVHDDIVEQLDSAFSEYGFAVVVGHGVDSTVFDGVYHAAKTFFRSEHVAEKKKYDLGLGYGYGGYLSVGHEAGGQLTGEANPDARADVVESLTCRGLQHLVAAGRAADGGRESEEEKKGRPSHFA